MTVHVWIPESTLPEHRSLLPSDSVLHDLPDAGPLPESLGPGQFLVATAGTERLIEVMTSLDDLRVVQTLSAGVDRLLGKIPPGVVMCDGSGIHDIPVAEWVMTAILASRHNLMRHIDNQRSRQWPADPAGGGDDLEGVTVLIAGYGSIGRTLESMITPFAVRILRVALHSREGVSSVEDLPNLLPHADIVVLLLPLTQSTRGLVDASFLSGMPPGALLVNASRGPIVDTGALTEALLERRIMAALDVTDPEPLPEEHPLWTAPGVMITPHVAGWVRRRLDRSWRLVADQVDRYIKGAPLRNVVTGDY